MKIIQKMIFISGLIVASIFFIYTLNFSSGWALGEPLGDFFKQAQIVNKLIYKWALWTVIFASLNIVFQTHKNINFYKLNFLFIALLVISLIGSGIVTIVNVLPLKASYLVVDQTFLTLITAINYSKISTDILILGYTSQY